MDEKSANLRKYVPFSQVVNYLNRLARPGKSSPIEREKCRTGALHEWAKSAASLTVEQRRTYVMKVERVFRVNLWEPPVWNPILLPDGSLQFKDGINTCGITHEAALNDGAATVAGTRVPVWAFVREARKGEEPKALRKRFGLTVNDVEEIKAYYTNHAQEIHADLERFEGKRYDPDSQSIVPVLASPAVV